MRNWLLEKLTHRYVVTAFLSSCLLGGMGHMSFGCSGWDPTRPFERQNPDVDRALEMLEDGEFENAQEVLTRYLDIKGDRVCKAGKIGLPDKITGKTDGVFDLGLVLFHLAEKYGERFGDEPKALAASPDGAPAPVNEQRENEVKCGLLVALAIARDPQVSVELRARAFYLAGNLQFLLGKYKLSIDAYAETLRLVPGIQEDAGGTPDAIGRDAAWNRAVALRRLEKEQDAGDDGEDAGEDGEAPQEPEPQQPADGGEDGTDGAPDKPDGPEDGGGGDAGDDGGEDAGDGGKGKPEDAGDDGGQDAGDDGEPVDSQPDAGDQQPQDPDPTAPPIPVDPVPAEPDSKGPSSADQGDKILDHFDKAPSYQQEEAKKRNEGRKRTMEDK